MIVFFKDSQLDHIFTQYYSPAQRLLGPLNLSERFHHWNIYQKVIEMNKVLPLDLFNRSSPSIFIHAFLLPSGEQIKKLVTETPSWKNEDEWMVVSQKKVIAFKKVASPFQKKPMTLAQLMRKKPKKVITGDYRLIELPHHWVTESLHLLESDMEEYIEYWKLKRYRRYRNLWVGKGVVVHPYVDIAGDAPIALNDHVQVKSFSCLEGPLVIGRNTLINSHSSVKHSLIGKTVKLGGEVYSSIVSDYSNKAHHGYLGNSYLGEWVNIGAGSVTSNLKNNYRRVKYVDPCHRDSQIESGETFLGSMIGDFAKISINSLLAPGTTVGIGASIGGKVEGHVEDFSIRESRKKIGTLKLSSFIETHQKMFARRNFIPQSDHEERIKSIYQKIQKKKSKS